MTKNLFRWEQDRHGGDHGIATYFPDTPYEISLRIDSFKQANQLYTGIEITMQKTRWDARAGLLAEIGRIKP